MTSPTSAPLHGQWGAKLPCIRAVALDQRVEALRNRLTILELQYGTGILVPGTPAIGRLFLACTVVTTTVFDRIVGLEPSTVLIEYS